MTKVAWVRRSMGDVICLVSCDGVGQTGCRGDSSRRSAGSALPADSSRLPASGRNAELIGADPADLGRLGRCRLAREHRGVGTTVGSAMANGEPVGDGSGSVHDGAPPLTGDGVARAWTSVESVGRTKLRYYT